MPLRNFIFQIVGWSVGLPLTFLVISAMLRGPYRRFPLLFAYTLASFVVTLVEVTVDTESFITKNAAIWSHAARIFWVNEGVLDVLILATVINLIAQAISAYRGRRLAILGLSVGALLFASVSLFVHYLPDSDKVGYWMTPWSRDMSVCSTVLALGLWMTLIASGKSDRQLLLITGALGMQFTGEAIGAALRQLSISHQVKALSLTGSVVAMLADLACLYVWWRTFRSAREPARSAQQ
jgi:hypothetical protein